MHTLADRRILGSTVSALTGGRWAISWWAYAVNAPVNFIAIGSNAGLHSTDVWWPWIAAATLGYLAFGAVFLVAQLTTFRHRAEQPMPLWTIIALGGVAGGLRGLVVGAVAGAWGLTDSQPGLIFARVLIGVVLGAVLVPLVAFMLGCIDAYRTQRSELIEDLRRVRASVMQEEGLTRELEAALLSAIRTDLNEVVRTQDPAVAREVSHRIWNQADGRAAAPRLHWSAILRASVHRNPFATVPVATIWAVAAIGTLTAAIGLPRAIGQIAFSVAAIAVVFAAGRRLVSRFPKSSIGIVISALAILDIITGPVASTLFDPRPWPAGAGLVIANSIWLPLLALTSGLITAALRSSEAVLADLSAQISDDELAAIVAHDERERLRREIAIRLHGTVQSRLLAASATPTDPQVMAQWVGSLGSIDVGEPPPPPLVDRITAITTPWSALMEIELNVTAPAYSKRDDAIVRVIEEAVTNAYRHGNASTVRITIDASLESTDIRVIDDGCGLPDLLRPGMGTAVFDTAAPGAWALTTEPDGTAFIVRLRG